MRVKSECKNKDKKESTQSARSARSAVCSLHDLRFGVTEMQETNKNTDYSGETRVAGKSEPISPRVAASLGEPMLGCNIGWTRRGVPFWEVNTSDSTMTPSWRDPDLLPRVAIALTVGQSAA